MSVVVLVCGNVFDGISDTLTGPAEILVEDNRIAKVERSAGRPPGARVINISERTVSPGFIDTHVHLTMDATRRNQADDIGVSTAVILRKTPISDAGGHRLRCCRNCRELRRRDGRQC
jgi:imidazolonepropionase-like amidohydrolase